MNLAPLCARSMRYFLRRGSRPSNLLYAEVMQRCNAVQISRAKSANRQTLTGVHGPLHSNGKDLPLILKHRRLETATLSDLLNHIQATVA